mmetsp:Transcript_7192/g.8335  ORF Transcript_7192/g.8335 Transcript_7192/m.8335 type:complete len:80 (+) Transcript_7192:1-240(+)
MMTTDLLLIDSSIRNDSRCPVELPGNGNHCSARFGEKEEKECIYLEHSQMGSGCSSHYLSITCRCVDKHWDYDVECSGD